MLIILLVITLSQARDCLHWGTYKPSLHFHYQEKEGIHIGLMYKRANQPLKHRYTTKNVYSTYLLHDFEGTVHSTIRDEQADMDMDIRVINNCEEQWQTKISIIQGFTVHKESPLEAVLYFYKEDDEDIRIKKISDNYVYILFMKSKKLIKVNVSGQDNVIYSKTLQHNQPWKVVNIYPNIFNNMGQEEIKYKPFKKCKIYANPFKKLQIRDDYVGDANLAFLKIILTKNNQVIDIKYGNNFIPFDFDDEFLSRHRTFGQRVNSIFMPDDFNYFHDILATRLKAESKFSFRPPDFKIRNLTESFNICLQRTLSNLLGGILFYKGSLDRVDGQPVQEKSVYAASPSRTRFPRAFLWDEGFHLISICKWNGILCRDILQSWFELMDEQGWIAREQARGEEIQNEIPFQFISQDPSEANPPTLLLPIRQIMIDLIETQYKFNGLLNEYKESNNYELYLQIISLSEKIDRDAKFLGGIYPKLQLWRKWFSNTQTHQNQTLYRWKCKGPCTDGQFYGSGMDDYPRNSDFAELKEHLDLKCWVTFFDQTLEILAQIITPYAKEQDTLKKDYNFYQNQAKQNLLDLNLHFLDSQDHIYKDYAFKSEEKDSDEIYEEKNESSIFIYEPGYVNLFPLFFGVVKSGTTEHEQLMKFITNKDTIWTDNGLRSLSKESTYYGTQEDYWRGAIWMPLNYLTLRGMRLYLNDKDSTFTYTNLRFNIITNLYKNWENYGYMFENYNGETGVGQQGYPFDGWTGSMFLAICAEIYV